MTNETEYGWNDEIENDGEEFKLLPAGEYDFTIHSFERARHDGSKSLSACNKAVLKVLIGGGEIGKTFVTHNLFLHSKCEGFLCAFFTSIGQRSKGQKITMNWNEVPGSTGRCKLGVKTYNGDNYNEIKKFLPPQQKQEFQQGTF